MTTVGKYKATLGGKSWGIGRPVQFNEIEDAQKWAQDYSNKYRVQAEWCNVYNENEQLIASYRRDPNGDGTHWVETNLTKVKI